jgi:hypothetical protein
MQNFRQKRIRLRRKECRMSAKADPLQAEKSGEALNNACQTPPDQSFSLNSS